MKIKMKKLLEGFAWERTPGKALPTMADVQKKYQQNLKEVEAFPGEDEAGMAPRVDDAGTNVVSKKFDKILKDKQSFQNIKNIYGKVSVIKQVDFLLHLLDTLETPDDARKKLKMKL
tara:strand:- start:892 stop:1242 length:351 start_codon:yes stop_codon:yes gene_type:complete